MGCRFDVLDELRFVDTRKREHYGSANHVLLGLLERRRPGPVSNIRVTCRINNTLREDGFSPSLTLHNSPRDSITVHDGSDE